MLVADVFIGMMVLLGIWGVALLLAPVVGFLFELVEGALRETDSDKDLHIAN